MKKWFRIICLIPIVCLFILTAFKYVPLEYTATIDEEGYFIIHWTNWVYDYHLKDVVTLVQVVASATIFGIALLNEGAEQPPKLELEKVDQIET